MARLQALLLIAMFLPLASAFADEKGTGLPAHCLTQETAAINVQLQAMNKDANMALHELQTEVVSMQSLAKQSGMTKMVAGGVNYSVTPVEQSTDAQFQAHGNINFLTAPSSKALVLVEDMRKHNYQATLSFVVTNGVTNDRSNKCRLVTGGGWE